jgi:hypothetical protein
LWSGLFTIEMCLFGNNTMVSTQIHRVTSQNGAWNANKVYMVVPKLTFITSHVRWFDIFFSRKFGNLNKLAVEKRHVLNSRNGKLIPRSISHWMDISNSSVIHHV